MTLRFFSLLTLAMSALAGGHAVAQISEQDLADVERQLKDQAAEERRLLEEAEARAQEVAALRHRLIETADALQEAERAMLKVETSIGELESEKTAAETSLRLEAQNLSQVLAALQSLELSRPPAILVTPEDANRAARAAMLLSDAAPEVEARAAALRSTVDQLAILTDALASEREAYIATNIELSARRDVLSELMAQKESERDVVAGLASAAQRESAKLAARATDLREVLRRLERVAHLVTPRLKPPPPRLAAPGPRPASPSIKPVAPRPFSGAKSFAAARGALRSPVTGSLVGSFGKKRPEGGVYEGLRFSVPYRGLVTAPFEGRVVFARDWSPIGNLIVLDVGGGYHVLFVGVDAILVDESQTLAAGEPIARMAAGGSNLDLEIRKNGEPVNPALWLSKKTMDELAF
ncbi:MAG: peptidoglycan DD-metalloendopeptidase family protein [Pseudomonadota bacterium]